MEKQIVHCEFVFKCPLKWENLEMTNRDDVRFCRSCCEKVYFAANDAELEKLKEKNVCIAVLSSAETDSCPPLSTMGIAVTPEGMARAQREQQQIEEWQQKNSFRLKQGKNSTKSFWNNLFRWFSPR